MGEDVEEGEFSQALRGQIIQYFTRQTAKLGELSEKKKTIKFRAANANLFLRLMMIPEVYLLTPWRVPTRRLGTIVPDDISLGRELLNMCPA